jgi:hypothetical protein
VRRRGELAQVRGGRTVHRLREPAASAGPGWSLCGHWLPRLGPVGTEERCVRCEASWAREVGHGDAR